jgi:hypothetical protein
MKHSFREIMRFGLLAAKKNTRVIFWMSEFKNIIPKVYRLQHGQCQSTKNWNHPGVKSWCQVPDEMSLQ